MSYVINKYTYKCKHLQSEILARTKETADKIIAVANTESSFIWKPKIFGFVKKVAVDEPPLELEEEQMEYVLKQLDYRRKHKRKTVSSDDSEAREKANDANERFL